ncbi:MAG: hypothetical protein UHK60_12900 [Acutalibacteraceae bacterium]|nr:hypothetical protein [Acutalibacteraceae bacterium]
MIIVKRTTAGLLMIVLSIFVLIYAISETIGSIGDLPDYHSVTSDTVKSGMYIDGVIDVWDGPVTTEDNREYYFLYLDNGQVLTYVTYNKTQKEILSANGGNQQNFDESELKVHDKLVEMNETQKRVCLDVLIDSGLEKEIAKEVLVPYYVADTPWWVYLFFYVIAFGGIAYGFYWCLPKLRELLGFVGNKKTQLPQNNGNYTGYQSVDIATQSQTYNSSNYQNYNSEQELYKQEAGQNIPSDNHFNNIDSNVQNPYNNDSFIN